MGFSRKPRWELLWASTLVAAALPASADDLAVCARPNAGFFASVDEKAVGFELDLLAAFAADEGLDLQVRWAPSFGALLDDVAAGRCDVGAAAITITEERRRRVAFSSPYFPVRAVVVAPIDRTVTDASDLAGASVAAVAGTQHETLLRALGSDVEVVTVAGDDALFAALRAGDVDALVCDSVTAVHHLRDTTDFRVKAALSEPQEFGFALPRESRWVQALSSFVETLRADTRAYRSMLERHFPSDLIAGLFESDESDESDEPQRNE